MEIERLCRTAALAATIGVCAGCHAPPKLTGQQAEGKRLYEIGCAHCHEKNDLHLSMVPPNLHRLFERAKLPDGEPATDSNIERAITTGKGSMPPFAYQMSKEQMDAVVAYLHTGLNDQPGD